jgi:hypothetical protein
VGWGRGCAREETIEWEDSAELVFEAVPVGVGGESACLYALERTTAAAAPPTPPPTHT